MSDYGLKLKDPRWQKMRLEIMERDGWKCRLCRKGTETLHVHHFLYEGDPWEAPPSWMMTFCSTCHDMLHAPGGPMLFLRAVLADKEDLSEELEQHKATAEWRESENAQTFNLMACALLELPYSRISINVRLRCLCGKALVETERGIELVNRDDNAEEIERGRLIAVWPSRLAPDCPVHGKWNPGGEK